jgi:pilus assembly protein CpaC
MVNLITNQTGRLAALCLFLVVASNLYGQQDAGPVEFAVTRTSQQLEMVVNTSRILTLDKEVPRAMVNNPDIVRVVPLSPNKVQLSAVKAGVTQVNLWDEDGNLYTVNLIIIGDAQELNMLLKTEFPQASIRVRPLSTSVVLSGRVDRSEDVSRIVRMAEDYYPKVINNITVGGVQQVLLHVRVMEVSRTKLRAIGFDWANIGSSDFVVQSVSGTLGSLTPTQIVEGPGSATITFGLIGDDNSFFGFLEALRDNNLAKILAEPTLVTVSGRPASFNAGGEFPILVPQSLGTISVEYKQFGTRVDFVPIVLGDGNIRLEVRPQVSELDNANGVTLSGTRIPALRTRWVDTAVEMRAGQTLALAGLIQTRVEAQNRGIPWLADLPWAGAAFRRVQEQQNEIELVVTVRPELVEALDPHEVPQCFPGEQSTSPNDVELYFRGYLEVPNCCTDGSCANCQAKALGVPYNEMPLPAGQAVPAETLPPVQQPAPGDGAAARGTSMPLGGSSYRPAAYSQAPITGRQIVRESQDVSGGRRSTDDPGLFGRIGYDDLDYKE